MEFLLQVCGYLIGLPLQILVIAALLKGGFRRFPFVFAYTIVNLLTTVVEMPSYLSYYTGNQGALRQMVYVYWIDEIVLQFMVCAVVASLLFEATSRLRSRNALRVSLIGGILLFAAISLLGNYETGVPIGVWMTPLARNLNFGSAILDLALWAMLISAKEKDSRLLMLSGALGIEFTGEAIGQSLRHLSPEAVLPGNILVMLTNLIFLYIWWQAFREPSPTPPSPRAWRAPA